MLLQIKKEQKQNQNNNSKNKKCLPEPDAAPHKKEQKPNQNNNSKKKKVYLSQMLLYMDLKVLASSREGGVAPWAVHLFKVISLFFLFLRF